jgi:drug/metabolite transporter (DMT)-like permease
VNTGAGSLALLAAVLFAVGVVCQQRGALAAPSALSTAFLRAVVTNRIWLAGAAAQAIGWIAQAPALDRGPLLVVQSIISLQVVFALPLGIALTGQHVSRREWAGAGAAVVGLAAFLAVSNPAASRTDVPAGTWLLTGLVVAGGAGLLAVVGYRLDPRGKASLFGTAAGIMFGFQAAVTKLFVDVVPHGFHAILTNWSTYALLASAVVGFYLVQISLQAGVLAPAIATYNVANPVTSGLLGRIVFEETPQRSGAGKAVSLLALAALVLGLVAVSTGEATRRRRARSTAP